MCNCGGGSRAGKATYQVKYPDGQTSTPTTNRGEARLAASKVPGAQVVTVAK